MRREVAAAERWKKHRVAHHYKQKLGAAILLTAAEATTAARGGLRDRVVLLCKLREKRKKAYAVFFKDANRGSLNQSCEITSRVRDMPSEKLLEKKA